MCLNNCALGSLYTLQHIIKNDEIRLLLSGWIYKCGSIFLLQGHFCYSYRTSFGKKYDHFSLLCKQMDIYLRKLLERLPQRRNLLLNPILVYVMYIARDEF